MTDEPSKKELVFFSIVAIIAAYFIIGWQNTGDLASRESALKWIYAPAIEEIVFEQVNQERNAMGVQLLTREPYLDGLAKKHSDWMLETRNFVHSKNNVGENIIDTPIFGEEVICGVISTNQQIANCMFDGWKNSPGHYRNMINGLYSRSGIGVACNAYDCMGTQTFN